MKVVQASCPSCLAKALSVFHELSKEDIDELTNNKVCNFYKKGQVVFYEGRIPTGIYCLERGRVKIFKVGFDGKEQIVRFATAGGLLGLHALLGRKHYSASAATLEDSVICFINRSFFYRLLDKYPTLSKNLIESLCTLLEDAEEKIVSIAQKPVRERLAETLLILNRIYQPNGKAVLPYNISLPREDLANIVGTATETVIRLLSEFKEQKLISIKGRAITLKNIQGIKMVARIYD